MHVVRQDIKLVFKGTVVTVEGSEFNLYSNQK
jgi:hypothetical protein